MYIYTYCLVISIRVDRLTSSQAGGLYRLGVPTVMDQHVGPHPTISFFIHHTWWSNQINENYINNQIVQNSNKKLFGSRPTRLFSGGRYERRLDKVTSVGV